MKTQNQKGKQIAQFVGGEDFSASHFNEIVAVFNALLRLTITRVPAVPDASGVTTSTGTFLISNENAVLELHDG